MQPCLKVWVEAGKDRIVLSDYRVRLLEQVGETGSLVEAAAQMGLSYRRAWGKIREIESNLGLKLVQSAVGGPGGGSTHLTEEGERLVRQYQSFREALARAVAVEFARAFQADDAG